MTPCCSLAPTIEAIAQQFEVGADVAGGGREVDRIVGLQSRARYERALEASGATP